MNKFCGKSFRAYEQNTSKIPLRQSRFEIGSHSKIYQKNYIKTSCEETHILESCSVLCCMNEIFRKKLKF